MLFADKRLIILELNEVPLKVFNWFAGVAPNSHIARLMRTSTLLETVTEDKGHLSPWITWPTLHRGVINTDHTIFDFGQELSAINSEYPPVWDLLTKAGHTVGLFGSLHSYPLPGDMDSYTFYVPDTFAAGPECFPKELSAFQEFNLKMVDRSGRNVSSGLPLRDAAAFLRAAPGLGLRGATALKLVKQLVSERVDQHRLVRRRTSQVQIAFDFFLKELRRTRPEVALFFTNHVASSMHRFWPATFPSDYQVPFWTANWSSAWSDEIPFVMGEADAQIRDLMAFVESDRRYGLAVMTSMGQAAVNDVKSLVRMQLNFSDVRRFMRFLGVTDEDWKRERAMIPVYMVRVNPDAVAPFSENIQKLTVNGDKLNYSYRGDGVFNISLGQPNLTDELTKVSYDGQPVSMADVGLVNLNVQDEAAANAYHVPQGSLIFYDPDARRPAIDATSVSTREIAPAILRNFNVPRPSYMLQSGSIF